MGDVFLTWLPGLTILPSEFNSTLVNGKGRYPGGPKVDLAVVNVRKGKRSVLHPLNGKEIQYTTL